MRTETFLIFQCPQKVYKLKKKNRPLKWIFLGNNIDEASHMKILDTNN